MATKRESIFNELVDRISDSSGLERIFRSHGRSKGPFYLALGQAASLVQERLLQAGEDLTNLETKKYELEEGIYALEISRKELEEREQALENHVAQVEERLAPARGLLENAQALEEYGFGEEELARLSALLGQAAASHGLAAEEGVARFFETVRDYTQVLSRGLRPRRQRHEPPRPE